MYFHQSDLSGFPLSETRNVKTRSLVEHPVVNVFSDDTSINCDFKKLSVRVIPGVFLSV